MPDDTPAIRMRGAGYYSANTIGAKQVIDNALPLVLEAVAAMDVAAVGAPIAIADFGAADGGTSLDLHRAVIGALRQRAPERAITLTHTDLPHNDFSALFRLLHGDAASSAQTPLAALPGVFSFASGASFYRQIFPEASVSLGFSATAMHWLSRTPTMLAEHVHAARATGAEREAFRQQAVADWTAILLMRARELAPGGRLVLANFCEDEAGHYLGWTGGQNMHACFARHWQDLRDQGRITDAEFRRATFAQYYKTHDEFRAPLLDASSPVRQAGLRLQRSFTARTPCPYAARFRDGMAAA